MRGCFALVLMCVLGSIGLSCAPKDQSVVEQTRTETIKAFQPLAYSCSDGDGGQDRITIDQAGRIEFKGRMMGQAAGQLSEFQMMQLARLCEGWDKLSEKYCNPADARLLAITCGKKTVTANENKKDLPEQFLLVRQKIETLARDLPATAK
jgi:hypothetical protein